MQSSLLIDVAACETIGTFIGQTSRQRSHPEQDSGLMAMRRPGDRSKSRIRLPRMRKGAIQQM
jgi:hypothetical protein